MKVLIVEDCPDDADLLQAELERVGEEVSSRRVECASDMRDALAAEPWDLVISDHSMPCFSSTEALAVLKESGRDIPFIIYSNHISDEAATNAMWDGAQDYVRKGHTDRLIAKVRRELRNAAARSAKARAEENLYRLTRYDELTGLANRGLFCEEVTRMMPEVLASGRVGAVFLLNLDRFARINHTAGYLEGDRLLRQTAERLRRCASGGELVARLVGDRFAIFKNDLAAAADAEAYARRIIESFKQPFPSGGMEFYLTVSMGIAVFPRDGKDVSTLLVNADSAASLARHFSGNNYKCYANEMAQTASQHVILEAALRRAIERRELLLHYQPIVRLVDEHIIGIEALIRWNHPEHGLLHPDEFIPVADESGVIVQIGEWVLEEACRQTKALHERGFPSLSLSVNVSGAQFAQPMLLEHVDAAIARTGLDPECIELEITETVLMQDVDATSHTLQALKKRGIRISVDDFGTGYSSLNYLKRFPIDALKIDRSFTRDIASNEDDYAIVRAITALARSLNLSVVAEGVESEEQLAILRRERCDRGQGFLFSKPLALREFVALMSSERAPAYGDARPPAYALIR